MVAHTLMDVDPSPTTAETLPTTTLDSKPIVCLPYSLVPGLDTTSQSYQKAVMMLGKQQAIPDSVANVTSKSTSKESPLPDPLPTGNPLLPFSHIP